MLRISLRPGLKRFDPFGIIGGEEHPALSTSLASCGRALLVRESQSKRGLSNNDVAWVLKEGKKNRAAVVSHGGPVRLKTINSKPKTS